MSQDAQESSADLSSVINRAFKMLQDPHERGLYLLELCGKEMRQSMCNYVCLCVMCIHPLFFARLKCTKG